MNEVYFLFYLYFQAQELIPYAVADSTISQKKVKLSHSIKFISLSSSF